MGRATGQTNWATTTTTTFNAKSQVTSTTATPMSDTSTTTTYTLTDANGVYLLGQVGSITSVQGANTQTSSYAFDW
jgi:hypothetical protein